MSTPAASASATPVLQLGLWAQCLGVLGLGSLGKLAKANRLVSDARDFVATDRARAVATFSKAIDVASAVQGRDAERRQLLGVSFLARGRSQEQLGEIDAAVDSYASAREHLESLPHPALLLLAAGLARRDDASEKALDVYVELAKSLEGRPKPEASQPVYGWLSRACAPDSTMLKAKQADVVCRQLRSVAPSLEWVHVYIGQRHFQKREYKQALDCWQQARTLGSNWKDLDHGIRFSTGMLEVAAGRLDAAVDAFRAAMRANTESQPARFMFGKTLIDLADMDASSEASRRGAGEARTALLDATAALGSDHVTQKDQCPCGSGKARKECKEHGAWYWYLGRACLYFEDIDAATAAVRAAISVNTRAAEYHALLALCEFKGGRWDSAIESAQAALALNQGDSKTYRLLARAQFAATRYADAARTAEQAVKLNAVDAEALALLGTSLFHCDEYERAIEALLSVPEPRSHDTTVCLGISQLRVARYDEALSTLAPLLDNGDPGVSARYYVALAQAHLERFEDAEQNFTACLTVSSDNAKALEQRGHSRVRLGRIHEALDDYRRALALDQSNTEVQYSLAHSHLAIGEFDTASSLLTELLRCAPNHRRAIVALAWIAERQGAYADADARYVTANALNPTSYLTRRIGVVQCRLHKFEDAVSTLTAALSAEATTDAGASDETLYYHGWSAAQVGNYETALTSWKTLAARYPRDQRLKLNMSRVHYLYGKALLADARIENAIREWNHYLDDRPDDDESKAEIAKLYVRLSLEAAREHRPADNAVSYIERALALVPSNQAYQYVQALLSMSPTDWNDFLQRMERLSADADPRLSAYTRYHEAVGRLAIGDIAGASALLQRIADEVICGERGVDVKLPLALIAALDGRWQDAVMLLETEAAAAIQESHT